MDVEKLKGKMAGILGNIRKIDKDYIIIGIIVLVVSIFMIMNIPKIKEFGKEEKENSIITTTSEENKNRIEEKDNKENEEENEKEKEQKEIGTGILVHIDGFIKTPGVYEIKENDRVNTIIEKAGGLKEGASIKSINLAARLADGDKIYIPSLEEEKNIEKAGGNSNSPGTGTVKITKKSKVNINSANISELKQITGIGESTANKIIDYRENVGKFKKIEDIKEVKGIGDSKFESIKDKITI